MLDPSGLLYKVLLTYCDRLLPPDRKEVLRCRVCSLELDSEPLMVAHLGLRPHYNYKARILARLELTHRTRDLTCKLCDRAPQVRSNFVIIAINKIRRLTVIVSSKTIEIRFVLLLRHKLSHSDQDRTRSGLDRIRHDQGFPNLLRKMAS